MGFGLYIRVPALKIRHETFGDEKIPRLFDYSGFRDSP